MHDRYLPDDHDEAVKRVKKSVGKIVATQKLFDDFFAGFTEGIFLYKQRPQYFKDERPSSSPAVLKRQAFSDGMVIYIPLG